MHCRSLTIVSPVCFASVFAGLSVFFFQTQKWFVSIQLISTLSSDVRFRQLFLIMIMSNLLIELTTGILNHMFVDFVFLLLAIPPWISDLHFFFNYIFLYPFCFVNKIIFYSELKFYVQVLQGTSLRVVVGQRFFVPVVGQSVFVENGCDDDRINNYAFI